MNGWTDQQMWCRAYGHSWQHWTVEKTGRVYVITQVCHSCGTFRKQDMNSRGECSHWSYKYDESFARKGKRKQPIGKVRAKCRVQLMVSMGAKEASDA